MALRSAPALKTGRCLARRCWPAGPRPRPRGPPPCGRWPPPVRPRHSPHSGPRDGWDEGHPALDLVVAAHGQGGPEGHPTSAASGAGSSPLGAGSGSVSAATGDSASARHGDRRLGLRGDDRLGLVGRLGLGLGLQAVSADGSGAVSAAGSGSTAVSGAGAGLGGRVSAAPARSGSASASGTGLRLGRDLGGGFGRRRLWLWRDVGLGHDRRLGQRPQARDTTAAWRDGRFRLGLPTRRNGAPVAAGSAAPPFTDSPLGLFSPLADWPHQRPHAGADAVVGFRGSVDKEKRGARRAWGASIPEQRGNLRDGPGHALHHGPELVGHGLGRHSRRETTESTGEKASA